MPSLKSSPAELLLKKVHEKYLRLETYQDEGNRLVKIAMCQVADNTISRQISPPLCVPLDGE